MHPEIRQENPGSCPLCGMDLVPATDAPAWARSSKYPLTTVTLVEDFGMAVMAGWMVWVE